MTALIVAGSYYLKLHNVKLMLLRLPLEVGVATDFACSTTALPVAMYAMYEESSTTNSGPEKPTSTRPADLARDGNPQHIVISASSYHNSNCVSEHAKSRAEVSEQPALEESEFMTHSSSKVAVSSSIIRTREGGGANYGAITQGTEEGVGGDGLSQERKQSAASGGQAYDKIASRNKRAQHATTYANHIV